MTFEDAIDLSHKLELNAWEGIALRLPDKEDRIRRYIDFNPFMHIPEISMLKTRSDQG